MPPFDHPMIIAGQGTAALELLEEAPDTGRPRGLRGGRRTDGWLRDDREIDAARYPNLRRGAGTGKRYLCCRLRKGERVTIPPPDTIADGLRAPSPGKLTFPIIQRHVEKILLVSEDEIRATMRFLLERLKILVEPSGAVAAAAVLFGKLPSGILRAGVVISGGNVDLEFLKTC